MAMQRQRLHLAALRSERFKLREPAQGTRVWTHNNGTWPSRRAHASNPSGVPIVANDACAANRSQL